MSLSYPPLIGNGYPKLSSKALSYPSLIGKGTPTLSSEALSHPQLVGNEAGVRQYLSEVLVNRFTFLESKKSNVLPEPIEPFNYQQQNSEILNHSFETSQSTNYNNPFATATTLAGGLNGAMNPISVSDDLPFSVSDDLPF